MNTTIFAFSLGLPVVLTVGVMGHLRPILRYVPLSPLVIRTVRINEA